ncbi:hypothetical protein PG993_001938 [Apiospora rasikravindrae]|uniref:Uncharacterized protein n=1 Tax=Apiospora rasikravindrae TaxID=990691 RepID=A0ABR1UCW8_9PEZI
MDCHRTDTPEFGPLTDRLQHALDAFKRRDITQDVDGSRFWMDYRRPSRDEIDIRAAQFAVMRDSLEYHYERLEEEERQRHREEGERQRQTLPTNPPRPTPRRVDSHLATLAALEGREPQKQASPEHHDGTREVERRGLQATHTRPCLQRRPRPQPRPQTRARPPVVIRDGPVVIYRVPVVIQQVPIVVREAPGLLTSDLGTPTAPPSKSASLRGPVKKFFKAVARLGRK